MSIEQDLNQAIDADCLPDETPLEREMDREQAPSERDYERRWWTLAQDLHTGASGLQWIVDAYSLVFAGLLLTAGSLGDRYGRRLALNAGLIVFGAASLFAALSSSAGAVIGARAVMGVGAAFVMPATLSILAHVFPPKERPRAIAISPVRAISIAR